MMAEESGPPQAADVPPTESPQDEFEADPTTDPNFPGNTHGGGGTNKRTLLIGVFVVLVIAIVVVGFAVGVSGGGGNGDPDPNAAAPTVPTPPPAPLAGRPTSPPPSPSNPPPTTPTSPSNEEYMLNLVTMWSGAVAFTDAQSPQSLALKWILEEDAYGLTQNSPILDIQQRYTMAVLYYATQGGFWSDRCRRRRRGLEEDGEEEDDGGDGSTGHQNHNLKVLNFLTDSDVCDWNDGKGGGLICNGVGEIQHIVLGTSSLLLFLLLLLLLLFSSNIMLFPFFFWYLFLINIRLLKRRSQTRSSVLMEQRRCPGSLKARDCIFQTNQI
jgi:hypothetical protein